MIEPPPLPKAPIPVRLMRLAILCCLGLALLAIALLIALAAIQLALRERILPGASIGSLDIGGMTRADALAALEEQYAPLEGQVYSFHAGQRSYTATASQLGLRLPLDELVAAAYDIGHGEDLRQNLREQAEAWLEGLSLPLRLEFDQAQARAYLRELADEINRPRQDAQLLIEGQQALVQPGHSSRQLDIDASLERLADLVLQRSPQTDIDLLIHESPPRAWNIEDAAEQINIALSSPLHLIGSLPNGEQLSPWILTREQILSGLRVSLLGAGDARRYEVSVDLSAFASYLRTLSPNLSKPPIESRFDFDPASGSLNPLWAPSEGRQLNVAETIRRLERAVFDPLNRRVVMHFDILQPRYPAGISAQALGIREQVAESTTYFWGSWQNRRSNISLGAGKLHGVIIAPGEEFSFNQHLGEITPEAGYLEGSVILGGATVTGIGGGICQVSTTMYRAAYSGGYAITERNSHGYRVGYYEYAGAGPGLDAAIWQPQVDLRFYNDTPYHLLIESSFLGAQDALQFRIYSSQHRQTEIERPVIRDIISAPPPAFIAADDLALGQSRQIDYSADGADVVVYRNIYDLAGNLIQREQTFTRYSPWQAVFEVAPGDPRLEVEDEAEDETGDEDEARDDGIAPVGVAD